MGLLLFPKPPPASTRKVIHPTVKSHKWKSFFRMYSDDAGEIQLLDFPPAARKANNEIILAIFPREDARRETSSPKAKMEKFLEKEMHRVLQRQMVYLENGFQEKVGSD